MVRIGRYVWTDRVTGKAAVLTTGMELLTLVVQLFLVLSRGICEAYGGTQQGNDGVADGLLTDYELLDEHVVNLPVGKFPEPECSYRVHLMDKQGPVLNRQVQIGEPIYHHWSCGDGNTPNNAQLYCILVNNCTVSSSRPDLPVVPIIDEFGCSLFPSILPHVHYTNDLDGGLKTNAFSLDVDQPAVTFNCNIKLLLKLNGVCRRPQCIPLEWYQRQSTDRHF